MPEQARYDAIGKGYNATRRPDERIVKLLVDCLDLPPGAHVIDIGAGTGNYTQTIAELGHLLTAVCCRQHKFASHSLNRTRAKNDRLVYITSLA